MAPNTTLPGGKVYQPNLRLIAKVPTLKTKSPDFLFELWKGYWNMPDPTTLTSQIKESVLTYPSINCSIPYNDMVVPDLGKTLLGEGYSENVGMNGQYTKYVNKNGDQMEVRTWRSAVNPSLGDVIEVYWTNTQTNVASWVRITENDNPLDLAYTNPTTNAIQRFKFSQWNDANSSFGLSLQIPRLIWVNGTANIKSWTGGITVIGTVTGTSISTASGTVWSELGFPNLSPSSPQTATGVNVVVNGVAYTVTGGWDTSTLTMASTAGISSGNIAVSQPTQVEGTAGVTLNYVLTSGVVLAFQANEVVTGSVSGATATVSYVVSGEAPYLVVMPLNGAEFIPTETITGSLSDATGTVTGVTAGSLKFDYCDNYLNYMLYGSWNSNQFYVSNEINYAAQQLITNFNAGTGVIPATTSNVSSTTYEQANTTVTGTGTAGNDLSLTSNTFYTGLGYQNYNLVIDSVSPAINQQNFISVNGGTNGAVINTIGYDALGNNNYQLAIISDITIAFNAGAGNFTSGEYLKGQTSGAIVQVVFQTAPDSDVTGTLLTTSPYIIPVQGEIMKGSSSGSVGTVYRVVTQNCAQFYKNNILQVTPAGSLEGNTVIQLAIAGNFTLIDGLVFNYPNIGSNITGDYWILTIQTLGPDTFRVEVNGSAALPGFTGIPINSQTAVLTYTVDTGAFFPNERIFDTNGTTQEATGLINNIGYTPGTFGVNSVVGTFGVGDIITGQQSGATGTVLTVTTTTVPQSMLGPNGSNGVQVQWANSTGHNIGDQWTISCWQAVTNAFANFYYTIPIRRPGEGYVATLPSNFWTMGNQENVEYINMQNGVWWYFQSTLARNLQSENLSFQPLKVAVSNKAIDPWMVGYMENDLIFVGTDKVLNLIGRQELIQLPQIGNLSKPVQNDFNSASFVGGTIVYNDKRLNITSPGDSIQFQYDNNVGCKYWNPPKTFTENGMQSVIEVNGINVLMTHSNYRNQSFTMFTNAAGDGANNDEYQVTIRTPYEIYKNRWAQKQSNMAFSEGYITGNPPLIHTVFCDVNGSSGIYPHPMEPVVDGQSPDDSSLGQGPYGSHPLGSDPTTISGYWHEIWPNYSDALNWRLLAIQIDCITTAHTYSFLSLGMNAIDANYNNNDATVVNSVLPT